MFSIQAISLLEIRCQTVDTKKYINGNLILSLNIDLSLHFTKYFFYSWNTYSLIILAWRFTTVFLFKHICLGKKMAMVNPFRDAEAFSNDI